MSGLFPFITFKSFNNGYSYYSKIKKLLNEDYYHDLKSINEKDIEIIANYLNGINLRNKLFDSLTWSLYFNPIPSLEIYLLCAKEDEKSEFSVLFSKDTKNFPTEEVYAFTLMYIITLSKIGNKSLNFANKEISKNFVSIKPLLKTKYKGAIENFFKTINLIDVPFLMKKLPKFPQLIVKNNTIFYKVFEDFLIKIKLNKENKDILIIKDAIKTHGTKLVITMIGLLLNAIKRELIK